MQVIRNIKKIGLKKNKKFLILIFIEIFIILIGVINLFGKNDIYKFDINQMKVYNANGVAYSFENISLKRGTYSIHLDYITNSNNNVCLVEDNSLSDGTLRTNGEVLFSGLNNSDFDMWLLRNTNQLRVYTNNSAEGDLTVQGLTIVQNNMLNRAELFSIICIITFINIIYIYILYDRYFSIKKDTKIIIFGLTIITLLSSIPVWYDYAMTNGDLIYHLMRIEGIKDGIEAGQFPVRISPEWQQGYGYASPIFYGETILFIAGLFRLIGFSVITSYRLYMFVITVLTVLIAYFCFKKVFDNKYIGLFCSFLYTLSIYRIYKTYSWGLLGENLGIMIMPILLYGFYRVFTQDIHEDSYKKAWIPLTIGFTLIVQSHLLSSEIVGLFTIIMCLILIKKVFRKKTFIVLAKTVIYSILASAWFLIPFVDYMLTGNFVINNVSERTIQDRGLFPAHLLYTFFKNGMNVFFDTDGMADTAAIGLGMCLTAVFFIIMVLLITGKLRKLENKYYVLGKILFIFSGLAMLMSLSLFPWNQIQFLNGITQTLVSSIQFPNRFLIIANISLTALAGLILKYVLEKENKKILYGYVSLIACLCLIGSGYLLIDLVKFEQPLIVYNSEGMGTGYISGAEYLPYGADASQFMYHDPVCSEDVKINSYEKLSLGAQVNAQNNSDEAEPVAFALLYYKGYQAYNMDTNEPLECYAGKNFEVTVDLPAGYSGNVYCKFVSPWYWRLGEVITLISVIVMAGSVYIDKCRKGGMRYVEN